MTVKIRTFPYAIVAPEVRTTPTKANPEGTLLTAGGGGRSVVETVALGSSGNTITHAFEDGYDYELKMDSIVPITNNTAPYILCNADSGNNYAYAWRGVDAGGSLRFEGSASDSQIFLSDVTGTPISNTTGAGYAASLSISNGFSASLYKTIYGTTGYHRGTGDGVAGFVSGTWESASALTSIFIGCTGATPHFSAGTATLYRTSRT